MTRVLCGLVAAAALLVGGCAATPTAASVPNHTTQPATSSTASTGPVDMPKPTTPSAVADVLMMPAGSLPKVTGKRVATATLNLWRSSTGSAYSGTVAKGTTLSVTGASKNGRLQIVRNSRLYWVTARYTKPAGQTTTRKTYERRVKVGTSVEGRNIYAYQVGDPNASKVALIIGQLHGDEKAGVKTAKALINDTRTVKGIQLWVIPSMNPDGNAASTRKNANGVDLNRNWPVGWQKTSKSLRYHGGKKPLNQPESKAVKKFITKIQPAWIVGLHQPLGGVDSDGVKDWKLQKALVKHMKLPSKAFTCSSKCGGTMTMWVNDATDGAMVTVEYYSRVSNTYAKKTARDGLVKALGGHY
jgi:hypothetical protein